ncbi:atrial natriuretic peptide receptor 1-like [Paramacrobiotus metropolitanus]|uniref:atrial natriuretic peptide receptor 1-like n=1 Tax=Paramacrobiotus metropolitanus TaxID=2943436 RepID=UPI0024459DC7|nr:atrial natriuretic peptide receptor 1-like [Paramacrobiotus metropolitanus]
MFDFHNCKCWRHMHKLLRPPEVALFFSFFLLRTPWAMTADVILISVHIGNNPLYGYFAAAPVYNVAVKHIKQIYPTTLSSLRHIPLFLPGYDLCADGGDRMNEFVTAFYFTHPEIFKNKSVYPVFGSPECTNQALALADLSREFDLPLFTSVAGDSRLTNRKRYPTTSAIAPLAGPDVLGCVDALLKRFNWKTLGLICDSMSHLPGLANFFYARCVDLRKFLTNQKYNWYNKEYDSAKERDFHSYLAFLKDSVRVFLILTIPEYLWEFMVTAYSMGLTNGEYVFIAIQPTKRPGIDTVSWSAGTNNDLGAMEAYKTLIVVTGVVPNWNTIINLTSEISTTAQNLFNYSYPPKDKENDMQIGIYESTRMMAQVFDENYPAVLGMPKAKFIQKFFNRSFNFAARNFSLDAVGSKINDVPVLRLNLLTKIMEPAMVFDTVAMKFYGVKNELWYWVGRNTSPPDKPLCGFRGNECDNSSPLMLGAIAGGVAAGVIISLTLGIVCYIRYCGHDDHMRWLLDPSVVTLQTNALTVEDSPCKMYLGRKGFLGTHEIYALPIKPTTTVDGEAIKKNKRLRRLLHELHHLQHANISHFFGIVCPVKSNEILLISSGGGKGSLRLLLDGQMQMLSDERVLSSVLNDLLEGMDYLHGKHHGHHGNITSLNCIIDSRYILKLSHINHLRLYHDLYATRPIINWSSADYRTIDMLWKAPEILVVRNNIEAFLRKCSTKECDVYAFGVIFLEVITKFVPYNVIFDSEKSVEAALQIAAQTGSHTKVIPIPFDQLPENAVYLVNKCFLPPHKRPTVKTLKKDLQKYLPKSHDLIRYLSKKLQEYSEELEVLVLEKTRELEIQRLKVEDILSEILPSIVIQKLRSKETISPELYKCVTIMFSDVPAFSDMVQRRPPSDSISFLTLLYSIFDEIHGNFDVYKVETVKDIHLVVSGLPQRNGDTHVFHICDFSLAFLHSVKRTNSIATSQFDTTLRVGINSGPCAAGVIGLTLPRYCLFGDTLNTASRMESTGEAGKIQISQFTRELIGDYSPYSITLRGFVEVKGKGSMRTYWLSNSDTN